MGRLCLTAVTAKQCLSSVFDRFQPHTSPLALPLSSFPSHASTLPHTFPPRFARHCSPPFNCTCGHSSAWGRRLPALATTAPCAIRLALL